jgi:hypothetical protein
MKKLTAEQHAEIIAEMRLAELFSVKMWARRYGVSPRTVKRLRVEARQRPLARNGPEQHVVLCLTVGGPDKTRTA